MGSLLNPQLILKFGHILPPFVVVLHESSIRFGHLFATDLAQSKGVINALGVVEDFLLEKDILVMLAPRVKDT